LDADQKNLTGFFGRDTVRLYTHYFENEAASQTLIENTPIEVAEQGSISPGIVAQNIIAGRTYSLYIGQGFDRAGGAVNGSNTFGGYDAGRFTDPVQKYDMDITRSNPMTVRVKDIILTDTSNPSSNTSLFDTSAFPSMSTRPTPFDAEISTDQYPLSLPYDITQNLISHLSAQEDNYWGDNSLKLAAPTTHALTIILSDGFNITLPPEILANVSNITPIQSRPKDSNAPFVLGSAFLSQLYLMADYDAHTFFLAPAVQKNNAVMPTTWCPKTTPEPYVAPRQSEFVKQGLIGAVIGGILGGMGIAAASYCLFLSWRRRRNERMMERREKERERSKMAQMEVEECAEFEAPPKSATPFFWRKRGG
jgi:hypothetical protein